MLAFIWDESTDSFVAGTTATDGSASSNLTVTEATLKAQLNLKVITQQRWYFTTAYVDTAVGNLSSNSIADADNDTKIQVEEVQMNIIRADTGGQEKSHN